MRASWIVCGLMMAVVITQAAHPMVLRDSRVPRGSKNDDDNCPQIICVTDDDSCTDWDDLYNQSAGILYICSGQTNCVGQTEFTSNGTCAEPFAIGTKCNYDEDCSTKTYLYQGDAYCDAKTLRCTLKKQQGDACTMSEECEPPLACDSKSSTCVDVRLRQVGEQCEGDDDYTCTSDLDCVDNVCVARSQLGQQCDDFNQKYCRLGLSCVAGICAPLQTGKPGQACSQSMDCLPGLVCDQNNVCNKVSPMTAHEDDCSDVATCDDSCGCGCSNEDGKSWCEPQSPVTDDLMARYWDYVKCMNEQVGDEYNCAEELQAYVWADPDQLPLVEDYCLNE